MWCCCRIRRFSTSWDNMYGLNVKFTLFTHNFVITQTCFDLSWSLSGSSWTSSSIYIGDSKIICTVGTRFAVGYTAGWAWQNTHGLLLSYHRGAGVTLIVHFCQEFLAINMGTPNSICTKEEQRAVIHFCGLKVFQVSKCIEWCQCSMGTVSCHNGLSVNGARGSKMVAQALSMVKEPDANPHPLLMQTLSTLLKTLRN